MSPVVFEHEENSKKCHHCHITKSIPLSELIKTHPLRSSVAKDNFENGEAVNQNENDKEEDKNKNGVGVNGESKSENNGNLIQSLLEEVANHKFKLKKKSSVSHASNDASNTSSLNRDEPPKVVLPVHSYLHHVLDKSAYNSNLETNYIPLDDLAVAGTSSSHPVTPNYESPDESSPPPDLILNAETLESQKSSKFSSIREGNVDNLNISLPKNIETQTSRRSSVSRASSSNVRDNPSVNSIDVANKESEIGSRFSTSTGKKKTKSSILVSRDGETQTSRTSSVSRATFNKIRYNPSEFSSIFGSNRKHKRHKTCKVFLCTLPSGLLFAGYSLLIVIGIVVAVALSQRERQLTVQSKALPRRPQFAGAVQVPVAAIREPGFRPRAVASQGRRVLRPVQRPLPRPNFIAAPVTAPPAPAPRHRPAPPQEFSEADFDYVGLTDDDFILPSKQPAPRPQSVQPRQQAFRPVEIAPQFRAQAPVQQRPVQQQAPAPRRGTPNTFKQEFNLQPQSPQEDIPRGQREPKVQIIKSWSNRNSDGTFSWGYINTDGSFKNETKGVDCVVRGVYGYVDETTGETLSFPYESGNPCDPDAPDYYFDYEDGTINNGNRQQVAQPRPSQGNQQQAPRRRP